MVADRPAFLHSMSNALAYSDDSISFSIHRADGASFEISCSMDQLADVFNYLLLAAKAVDHPEGSEPQSGLRSLLPIEVDGIGLGIGDDPDKTILLARIGGFDLTLSIPNGELGKLGRDLAEKMQALSVSGKPQ